MSSYTSSISSSNYTVFGTRRGRLTTVEAGVKCHCNMDAPCWEAWRAGTENPGRRFLGCSIYKDRNLNCGFFQWADIPYTERSKEVITSLIEKLSRKVDEVEFLHEDLSKAEKRNVLVVEMEKELDMKDACLAKMMKELRLYKVAVKFMAVMLVVSWIIIKFV